MKTKLSTPKGEISFDILGNGYPILLLAGGPGNNAKYLNEIAKRFSAEHKVILLHQRGTDPDLSKEFDPEKINVDTYIDDIESIREHLKIDRWNIFGHSWGGMLASIYGVHHKERINKMILVNSAGLRFEIFDQLIDNVIQRLSGEQYKAAIELASKLNSPDGSHHAVEFLKTVTPAYFYNKEKAVNFSNKINESFLNFQVFALVMQDVVASKLDITKEARNFNNSVLYIVSRQDVVGFQAFSDITNNYPNISISIIEKAGHYCWLEQPEPFYASITSFLNP